MDPQNSLMQSQQRLLSIEKLVDRLSAQHYGGLFNPWSDTCVNDLDEQAHLHRKRRLIEHLCVPEPRFVLIGEAAGYQGCRYSGIAFTSERLVQEGSIPRLSDSPGTRITARPRPWSEPSATIVWGVLHRLGIAESTLLWNAVPWHPEGKRDPLSNRKPTALEQSAGLEYCQQFLQIFPDCQVVSVGKVASTMLDRLGVEHTKVRHPAFGGAGKFRGGMASMLAALPPTPVSVG